MNRFVKAYGLGNDFAIFQGVGGSFVGLEEKSRKIADRRYGVGCDQVIFIEDRTDGLFARFFNPDGSEAEACGNGTRCVAKWLMKKNESRGIELQTMGGFLQCRLQNDETVEVDFPLPVLEQNIFSPEIHGHCDAVYVGNPHLVCFTDRPDELETLAPSMEYHPHFPNRTNVDFVSFVSPSHLKLRVWERGTGVTPACGSAAVASAYAAFKRGIGDTKILVSQQGGDLMITASPQHVTMRGEAVIVFEGEIDLDQL
jgi:diaminopimelate epimerase